MCTEGRLVELCQVKVSQPLKSVECDVLWSRPPTPTSSVHTSLCCDDVTHAAANQNQTFLNEEKNQVSSCLDKKQKPDFLFVPLTSFVGPHRLNRHHFTTTVAPCWSLTCMQVQSVHSKLLHIKLELPLKM